MNEGGPAEKRILLVLRPWRGTNRFARGGRSRRTRRIASAVIGVTCRPQKPRGWSRGCRPDRLPPAMRPPAARRISAHVTNPKTARARRFVLPPLTSRPGKPWPAAAGDVPLRHQLREALVNDRHGLRRGRRRSARRSLPPSRDDGASCNRGPGSCSLSPPIQASAPRSRGGTRRLSFGTAAPPLMAVNVRSVPASPFGSLQIF